MTISLPQCSGWRVHSDEWSVFNLTPKRTRTIAIIMAIHEFVKYGIFLGIALLAFYDFKEVGDLLGLNAIEESEYSRSHDDDVSYFMNGIRFYKASKMFGLREDYFNVFLGSMTVTWLSTFVLLYGVVRNSFWSVFYWLALIITEMVVVLVYISGDFVKSDFNFYSGYLFIIFFGLEFMPTCLIGLYARQLRMIDKLREEAIIAIPCPAPYYAQVGQPRDDQIIYNGSNGYTHILSNA